MITIIVVFIVSFDVVAAAMMAVVWAIDVNRRLNLWNERQRQRIQLGENNAAWERNREMIVY
jgi:hypothetical protein